MPKQPQAPGPAPEPAPDITLIAAMGLTVMPRIRLADDIAEIAAQVDRARDAAGRLGRWVLVDAVSAFGAMPLDVSAPPTVDAACFAAGKCLGRLPGAAFAVVRIA